MAKRNIISEIKSRIPKGKKVYLDGHYDDGEGCYHLWWYVHKEGSILWVESEENDGYGRGVQQAVNFSEDELQSVLESMTTHTVPDSVPCGVTVI